MSQETTLPLTGDTTGEINRPYLVSRSLLAIRVKNSSDCRPLCGDVWIFQRDLPERNGKHCYCSLTGKAWSLRPEGILPLRDVPRLTIPPPPSSLPVAISAWPWRSSGQPGVWKYSSAVQAKASAQFWPREASQRVRGEDLGGCGDSRGLFWSVRYLTRPQGQGILESLNLLPLGRGPHQLLLIPGAVNLTFPVSRGGVLPCWHKESLVFPCKGTLH